MINLFRKALALLGFSTLHFGKADEIDIMALKQNIPGEHRQHANKHSNSSARKNSPDIQFAIIDFKEQDAKKVFFVRRVIQISPRAHFRKRSQKRCPPC